MASVRSSMVPRTMLSNDALQDQLCRFDAFCIHPVLWKSFLTNRGANRCSSQPTRRFSICRQRKMIDIAPKFVNFSFGGTVWYPPKTFEQGPCEVGRAALSNANFLLAQEDQLSWSIFHTRCRVHGVAQQLESRLFITLYANYCRAAMNSDKNRKRRREEYMRTSLFEQDDPFGAD